MRINPAREVSALASGENRSIRIALENSELDEDGWALIAPFGEHPNARLVRGPGGTVTREDYIQVLDNQAALNLVGSNGTSLFRKLGRATVGLPVFREHPDLAKHSPETVVDQPEIPSPIGVVSKVRIGARGIEGMFTLTPSGVTAVENEGLKHPSAFWNVMVVGSSQDRPIRVRPFQLLSVGLTSRPNIQGVDSLANSADCPRQARNPTQELLFLANNDERYRTIPDWSEAWNRILAEHPQLAAQLRSATPSNTL